MTTFPTRYPTAAERSQWMSLVNRVDQMHDRVLVCRLLAANAAIAYNYGLKNGIATTSPKNITDRLINAEAEISRMRAFVRRVQDKTAAVQFRNGDLDIVDPGNQGLDGFFLILGGVVLVAGAIALAGYLWAELGDCERDFRVLDGATDKVFCSDPDSDTCKDWQQTKIDSGFAERKTWAQKIADGIGPVVKTGSSWGIAIAIPVLLMAYLWRK